MIGLFCFVLAVLASPFKSKVRLEAENAVLRHQLIVLRRRLHGRVRLTNHDRWFFIQLYRWFPSILQVLTIVRPETLVRWHRAGFRCYWRWKSRPQGGRPQIATELRGLIRQMSMENPLWGAPRIHGELLKLGFEVAQSSVAKYMVKRRGPPSQRWRTFLHNHVPVFYAALARSTAVAELRPGIGDSIAIGRFTTRVPLKVFDFTVFDQRAADRTRLYDHVRYDFITQMQDEISRPVRPHERQREYIATQIVAEYLKSYFGCDAVIYKSSMQRDGAEDNRNIVILHRETFVGTADPSVISYVDWSLQDVVDMRYSTVDGLSF
jgi:RES domain